MARLSKEKIDVEINKFAKSVIKRARGNLSRAGKATSKELWKSLGYRYANGVLQCRMAHYGPYVDQGVTGIGSGSYRPKRPRRVAKSLSGFAFKKGPVGPDAERSFAAWIRGHNIRPRNEMGQFVKQTPAAMDSLNFMLRRSTGRFGIMPTRFFSEAYEFYAPKFEKALEKAVGQSIVEAINKTFSKQFTACKN